MEFDQFKVLVKGMKSVYTYENFLPDAEAVKTWFMLLEDIPFDVAQAAIHKYCMINKKVPTVADIREMAASVALPEIPDWGEAWEQTIRAIRKYGHYRQADAMASLDPLTRKTVERLGFRNLCASENPTADRANFRSVYEMLAKREQTNQVVALPLQEVIGKLRIEGRTGFLQIGSGIDD